jgi:glycosyltransferase involved in cell wall biosynthesis
MSSLSRGGRERQLAVIVSNTEQEVYPTKIIYFNDTVNSYVNEYGLRQRAIKVKPINKFARLKEIHMILRNEKPDIVYTWGNIESVSALLVKPFHRFKLINGSVRHGIRSSKCSHYFRTMILHLSRNIVANSYAGLRANNLRRGNVLYNGIEDKFIESNSVPKHEQRQKLGLPVTPDTTVCISIANLVPYKDYFSVLHAVKKLKDEGCRFYYVILGDGPMRREIEACIDEYNLSNYVAIFGNIENVHEYLRAADIFIHSSKGEGCSNAILEAMAAGLPVIASRTGGTPEIVSEENGLLFEYKNVTEIRKYLLFCIENRDRCSEFGDKSIATIKERFSVKAMMNNYYNIVNTVSAS